MNAYVDRAAHCVAHWLEHNSVDLLRVSLGLIFCWFGGLKFFPGVCSAENIAGRTLEALSFGIMTPEWSVPLLAVWECLIEVGLVTGRYLRGALLMLFMQMMGTFTPLAIFPEEMFREPFVPTLEAQYILKNVVLVSAALVIGVRDREKKKAEAPGTEAARTA
jgi:uncharacterized membrane protein YkgB